MFTMFTTRSSASLTESKSSISTASHSPCFDLKTNSESYPTEIFYPDPMIKLRPLHRAILGNEATSSYFTEEVKLILKDPLMRFAVCHTVELAIYMGHASFVQELCCVLPLSEWENNFLSLHLITPLALTTYLEQHDDRLFAKKGASISEVLTKLGAHFGYSKCLYNEENRHFYLNHVLFRPSFSDCVIYQEELKKVLERRNTTSSHSSSSSESSSSNDAERVLKTKKLYELQCTIVCRRESVYPFFNNAEIQTILKDEKMTHEFCHTVRLAIRSSNYHAVRVLCNIRPLKNWEKIFLEINDAVPLGLAWNQDGINNKISYEKFPIHCRGIENQSRQIGSHLLSNVLNAKYVPFELDPVESAATVETADTSIGASKEGKPKYTHPFYGH